MGCSQPDRESVRQRERGRERETRKRYRVRGDGGPRARGRERHDLIPWRRSLFCVPRTQVQKWILGSWFKERHRSLRSTFSCPLASDILPLLFRFLFSFSFSFSASLSSARSLALCLPPSLPPHPPPPPLLSHTGTCQYANGDSYTGEFKANLRHGTREQHALSVPKSNTRSLSHSRLNLEARTLTLVPNTNC